MLYRNVYIEIDSYYLFVVSVNSLTLDIKLPSNLSFNLEASCNITHSLVFPPN